MRLLDHLLEQGQTSFGITQLQQSPSVQRPVGPTNDIPVLRRNALYASSRYCRAFSKSPARSQASAAMVEGLDQILRIFGEITLRLFDGLARLPLRQEESRRAVLTNTG